MKKILLIGASLLVIMTLAACSSKEKAKVEAEQGATPEEYEEYGTHLQAVFDDSNKLLRSFSNALDDLYTGSASTSQMAKILKEEIISQSGDIVKTVENYNTNPHFFDLNQRVTNYVNQQHQLFLDTIDQLNQERLNKDNTRKTFLSIKEQQSQILNTWKTM